MKNTWKRSLTAVLAFALAAEGMICSASFSEVSAAEQPVTSTHLTNESTAFTVDAGTYEANAGDTVKVKIRVSDIKESFTNVVAYLKVNTDYFTVLGVNAGDIDDPDIDTSDAYLNTITYKYASGDNSETISVIYSDPDLDNTDKEMVLATVVLKVNEDAKDGYYELPFSLMKEGGSMATQIASEDGQLSVKELDPEFHGALIKVGSSSDEIIDQGQSEEVDDQESSYEEQESVQNPETAAEYTYAETGQPVMITNITDSPAAFTVDAGVYEAKAGDTVKIKVLATDIKKSFAGLAAYLKVNTNTFTVLSVKAGDTDDPDNEKSEIYKNTVVSKYAADEDNEVVAFNYCNENIDEDSVLATIELRVKYGADPGNYELPFDIMNSEGVLGAHVSTENGFSVDGLDVEFHGALIKIAADPETPNTYTYSESGQSVIATHFNDGPAAFAVDAGIYEAKAGDTIKLKIRATDIKEAFCSLAGYLKVNKNDFTVLSVTAGDTDNPNNENTESFLNTTVSNFTSDENTETVSFVYGDIKNVSEDIVIATVELKVNDNVKLGSYDIPFALMINGGVMANSVDIKDGKASVKELDPEYRGALVKVVSASAETVPQEQSEASVNQGESSVNQGTSPSNQETSPENQETPSSSDNSSVQNEVPENVTDNEEPQNIENEDTEQPEETVTEEHHGHSGFGFNHVHHRNSHGHRQEKTIGQKIAEDISNAISNIAKFIFSLF